MDKVLHKHVCEDCIQPWEHADSRCTQIGRLVSKCPACIEIAQGRYTQRTVFAEMLQNMPIPHNHICTVCKKEWEHNDKACAITEVIYLKCKDCTTSKLTYPCPKCGTESEEATDFAYNVTRCVCPKCRHYFAPQGSKDGVYKAQEKEGAESNSEREYLPGSHNPSHAKEEGDADVCPQCGTQVTADVCVRCGYHILLDSTDGYEGVG